jgi:hypothetical protein
VACKYMFGAGLGLLKPFDQGVGVVAFVANQSRDAGLHTRAELPATALGHEIDVSSLRESKGDCRL